MTPGTAPSITAIAPWFGGNRVLARRVGQELGKLAWCGVPFMGGAPELPHIVTRGGVANDLHRHIVNLARVIADDGARSRFLPLVERVLFHPDEHVSARLRCVQREAPEYGLFGVSPPRVLGEPDAAWAADYFIACWMGRGGMAGQSGEFHQSLALRWTSSGGDSARRFRSAVESLDAWALALRGWSFTCMDAFTFLDSVKDHEGHGLYCDPPWPDAGDGYAHTFTESDHRRLARRLHEVEHLRVVIRYGDHPLIRSLYEEGDGWTWLRQRSRSQVNGAVEEVLIVNGASNTESPQ